MQVVLRAQAGPSGAGDSQEGWAFQTGGALCNLQLTEVTISDRLIQIWTVLKYVLVLKDFLGEYHFLGVNSLVVLILASAQQEACRFKA